jgi:hypothetical protein
MESWEISQFVAKSVLFKTLLRLISNYMIGFRYSAFLDKLNPIFSEMGLLEIWLDQKGTSII